MENTCPAPFHRFEKQMASLETAPFPSQHVCGPMQEDEERRFSKKASLSIVPGVILAGVGGGMAFPILPIASLEAGLSIYVIGLIMATNRVVRMIVAPWVGQVIDRMGGRRIFLAGILMNIAVMALFALGSFTGHEGIFFLSGRILHGIGSGCVFVSAQTLALHAGKGNGRGRSASFIRSAQSSSTPIGFILGGVLVVFLGDLRTFLLAMTALIFAAAIAFPTLPDIRARKSSLPTNGFSFLKNTSRELFPIFFLMAIYTFSLQGVLLATLVLWVHHLHLSIFHLKSQGTAGVLFALEAFCSAGVSLVTGRIADRWGRPSLHASIGFILLSAGFFMIGNRQGVDWLYIALALIGIGAGSVWINLLLLMDQSVPEETRGRAVGTLQFFGDAGSAIGAFLGPVLMRFSTGFPYTLSAALLLFAIPTGLSIARRQFPSSFD
ncbi:MAG: MFS transporter [Leptospirales bacterium]